ncbi:MAG: hypothetical protein AAGF26_08100 [Cyanobacteria bacterium P01_G01_bin.49]
MFNKLRLQVGSLPIIFALLVSLGLIGLFAFDRFSAKLKIEEDYTLNPSIWGEDLSVYSRKFQCVKVKQVDLQTFSLKAGQLTKIWDGYYSRTSGVTPLSSSCLFTLFSGPGFKSPWVEFSFSEGSTSSGNGRPLSLKKSLKVDDADGYLPVSTLQTAKEGILLSPRKPMLLYLKIYGNSTSQKKALNIPAMSSIQEVQDFSTINKKRIPYPQSER